MEGRLIPVNAFIALTSRIPAEWPGALSAAGYRLEALELPLNTPKGRVVADAVGFNEELNRFVVAEGKSGNGVDHEQAAKYGILDPMELVRSTGVTVSSTAELNAAPCYICLADGADGVEFGLSEAGCEYPLVVVGEDFVELRNAAPYPELVAAFGDGLAVPGPPPAVVRVDEESPDEEYDRIAAAALMARAARGDQLVSATDLAADAVPHLPIYGAGHRGIIQRKVDQALARICAKSPENFDYRGRTSIRSYGVVTITDSPERSDPRGRTQRYQAIAGRLGGTAQVAPPAFEQVGLFDDVDLNAELARLEPSDTPEAGEEEQDT